MKYLNWEVIKADFQKYSPWSAVLTFYFFALWNDYFSSLLTNHIPGIIESNPFARDTAMRFVLWKGLIVDTVFFLFLSSVAVVLYYSVKWWSKDLAKAASAAVYLYYSIDRILDAVVGNYLFALHLYVPHKADTDMLKMFGL